MRPRSDLSPKVGTCRRPYLNGRECKHHPKCSLLPGFSRIGFDKFLPELLRVANSPAREPERFFVVQAASLESGDGIAQMGFQFAPVIRREIRLCGQFVPPSFDDGVQVKAGLICHSGFMCIWDFFDRALGKVKPL